MALSLRILIVEDSADDAEVALLELARGGITPDGRRVESAVEMRAALADGPWDAVLSDYTMPGFGAAEAFALCRATDPDLPFIVVSGTIGEQRAVEMMRAGAGDYLLKGNLTRLPAAVTREVREAEGRRGRRGTERKARDLAAIVASSDDAIVGKTLDGIVTSWNAGAERLYGYAAEEIVGQNISLLIAPDRPDEEAVLLGRVASGERVEHYETERVRKDGTRVDISITLSPVRDEEGRVVGASAIARNIGERKRAEQELRRTSDLLRAVADGTPDAVFVKDRAGRYLLFNDAACRFVGKPVGDVLGRDDTALFDPASARRVMDRDRLVMESGGRETDEEVLTAAGVTRTYLATKASYRDANGSVIGVIGISQDITDRKAAEKALRASEARKAAILETALDCIITIDHEGNVVEFNTAAERTFGYRRAEVLGKDLARFIIPPSLRERHRAGMARYFATGEATLLGRRLELPALRADGTEFPAELAITRILTDGPPLFTAYLRDITDRKRAEQGLAERARLASLVVDVGLALSKGGASREVLGLCAEAVVQHLNAAFARIWTLNESEGVLELQASAGMYTHLDGPHGRVPVGKSKIGLIAQERRPHLTNAVAGDPRVDDLEWATREGMVAFAGYPLLVGPRLVGVIALFSRQPLSDPTFQSLAAIADQIAMGIDRRRVDAERAELLDRLNLQIERMPLAYVLHDADLRYTGWNPAAERTFGFTRAEVLGKLPDEIIVPPQSQALVADIFARLKGGDMDAHATNENITRDGQTITCEWYNTPLFDAAGIFTGILSLAQDVTVRKRLEEQYHQAQQRLHHVVASSPVVLFTLAVAADHIRGVDWISENLWDVLGHRSEAALSPDWWKANIHPDDRERVIAQTGAELFGHGRATHEYRFRHGDGSYRWTRGELRLIRDETGRPVEAVGSWSDITERKSLEEQFRQAQKMEAVGQLAGGVAHDFNNLLTVINGYGEIVHAALPADHPSRKLVAEIQKAGDRAAGLTRQLLAFSRQTVLETRVLDMNTLVRNLESMLRRLIGEDVDLATRLDPALGRVKSDPGQLEQAVVNLCVNARDAMPRGGQITIETHNVELDETYVVAHPDVRPGPYVLLAVTDTGIGMTPEVQARIFEPFYTTKGPGKGTGLGLAMVFGFAKQSGGHVAVYSEPGRGTTFKLYLPLVAETLSRKSTASLTVMPKGTETVLLVEDEDAVRALGKHVLRLCGYEVLEADHGREAVRIAQGHSGPIHLLVTDVVMPGGMGGREVAEAVVALHPEARVLYTSGYTDDAVVRHGVLEEGIYFLQKPFAPAALAEKVRTILDATAVGKTNGDAAGRS